MDTVIRADVLADRLDEVRVVDVRDAWEFDAMGHLPGAVNVPFDSFRANAHAAEDAGNGANAGADTGRQGMLPGAGAFADLLGKAGITREDHVVVYDDHHGVFAARLPAVEPTTYEVREHEDSPLVDIDEVAAAVESDAVLVDTREDWEYEEAHIPGAVRLDWRELVDDETRGILPREELEAVLEERGITPESRVVLYCNTARRISHTYVVLRHLGYTDLAFYEGSLTEWKAAGRDLATGAGE
ncbi:sulfurtransferase [Halobacteriales archaeon QH_6_68_27]|nr:MAG: sulfurtransferase [Halobacteriales archaeon QH_6_68_27]